MIIVNNSFYIFRVGPMGVKIHTGEHFAENTYLQINKSNSAYIGGVSLLQMISRIQTVSIVTSHIVIDFDEYLKKIDESLVSRKERIS